MQNSKSLSKVGDMRHEGSRGHRRKILVVDDNIDAANGLRYILESKGHELRVAYNGCSALEIAEIFHPEVIFLDIGMPGMDGYEVCRKARATAWGEGVLLVAITGWGQSEDKQRAYEAGFDCHFTKPVQVNDLDRILDKPKDE
jgi:CheY-like chemotaxis protein